MSRTLIAFASAAIALVVVSACGSDVPGKPSPTQTATSNAESTATVPNRPAELKLAGVDACKLITENQMKEIKVTTTVPDQFKAVDNKPQLGCFYENRTDYAYSVVPATNEGIKYWLEGTGNVTAKLVDVSGYGAAEVTFTGVDQFDCAVAVDVADGQQLFVSYKPRAKKGESQEQLCANAKKAAALALETLKTLK